MSQAQFKEFLRQQGADFVVVGHEPNPRSKKLDVKRKIRANPLYKGKKLINLDTRIGWEQDKKVAGTISYAVMKGGKLSFENDIRRPKGMSAVSLRMAQGLFGSACFTQKFIEEMNKASAKSSH
jgi:hypothetical protein